MSHTRIKRLTLALAVAGVVAALVVAVVLVMGQLHRAATAADVVAIDETQVEKEYPAGLVVRAKLAGVDLDKEMVTFDLEMVPVGADLLDPETGTRKDDISVRIADGANPGFGQTVVISADEEGTTGPAELDFDGNVADYPQDVHVARLSLFASRPSQDGEGMQDVPIILQAYGAWPGLHADFAAPPAKPYAGQFTSRELVLTVQRSHATIIVAWFSVALIWVLIITVIGMTLSVVLGQRDSQIAMLAFFGTLLFGLTEFRNMLPGAPPSGAYSDYLAFYWAYGVVILAVGVIGGLWLYRRRSSGRAGPASAEEADELLVDPADFS